MVKQRSQGQGHRLTWLQFYILENMLLQNVLCEIIQKFIHYEKFCFIKYIVN